MSTEPRTSTLIKLIGDLRFSGRYGSERPEDAAARRVTERLNAASLLEDQIKARPLADYHEDHGEVVWWTWENGEWLGEPTYIGSPSCDDWPGYHTHWTPHPAFPMEPR